MWPAVLAHVVNNTVSVLTLVLGYDLGTRQGSWIALVSGAVVALLAVTWIVRRAPRPRKLEPAFA